MWKPIYGIFIPLSQPCKVLNTNEGNFDTCSRLEVLDCQALKYKVSESQDTVTLLQWPGKCHQRSIGVQSIAKGLHIILSI